MGKGGKERDNYENNQGSIYIYICTQNILLNIIISVTKVDKDN